jgi:hypothetical protein
MTDLFGDTITPTPPRNRFVPAAANPMIEAFGAGPAGCKCKGCAHLMGKTPQQPHYKCSIRGANNSETTDQRVNWEACGKYTGQHDSPQPAPKASELEQIKCLLLDGKRLTVQSVLRLVHTQELRTYITILKRNPHSLDIDTEWKERNGKRFKEYFLKTA